MVGDGTVLSPQVEVSGRDAKRGDGHSLHWRGMFTLPENLNRRPMFGETLHIRLADNSQIAIVITESREKRPTSGPAERCLKR